ncbi:hypothetical protein CDEF62S_06220 [Castellaniella defragrans]
MWRYASIYDDIEITYGHCFHCVFCKSNMVIESIENRWPLDEEKLNMEHESAIQEYVRYVDDAFASHRPVISGFDLEDVTFHCCPVCGWWCIIQCFQYDTPKMPYMGFQWAAGALVSQDFPDVTAPISEVRSYLCACYEKRFLIDPYQLEDVVASVFRSFKCDIHLSNRSHDGGLDLFGFDFHGHPFGVQVKRYQKKIGVELIREFVGALILHGTLQGIFVTTSSFSREVPKLCRQARIAGIHLKCADAHQLFDMLRAVQIRHFELSDLKELAESYASKVPALNYGHPFHMNSL